MNETVSWGREGDLLLICVDNPPVNALSQSVRAGIQAAIAELKNDDAAKAAVLYTAGRTFIAGADIREFGKPPMAPSLPDVLDDVEACDKPVVAALHGTALGGGFEVALACHARVAAESAKLGLPEVNLGLLPGAGGTQRFPRLAGVANALDAMLTGRHVKAAEADSWGVLDAIVPDDDLLAAAKAHATSLIGTAVRRTGAHDISDRATADAAIAAASKMAARTRKGQFAPSQIIKCVEACLNHSLVDGLKIERTLFAECMKNPQSAAMRHVFFAERQISHVPGIDKSTPMREIKKVGVIGAGTMGGGIAMSFVNAGFPVTILEMTEEAYSKGRAVIEKNYQRTVDKGRLSADIMATRMGLFGGTTSYEDLADCDLIIEAVFEKMEIKKEVFGKLDAVAKQGAILASNTSYLDIDAIAQSTNRPGDVIGLHFFSPANVMRLLEIVRGKETGDDVLATSIQLSKKIRKVGVVSGNCHGFIGNRMLRYYGHEANLMVIEGASPEEVDAALTDFGMAMGPLAVGDLAGLDIGYMTRQSLGRDHYDTRAYDWVDRLVEQGRKGQKTGMGIYKYEPGNRTPITDPEVAAIIEEEAAKAGMTRAPIDAETIVQRCMLALANSGAQILEEGIALRASDIDMVYLNGYGFPAYKGGPMHNADAMGLDKAVAQIKGFAAEDPDNWTLSPLLEKLAAEGKTFADFDLERGNQ